MYVLIDGLAYELGNDGHPLVPLPAPWHRVFRFDLDFVRAEYGVRPTRRWALEVEALPYFDALGRLHSRRGVRAILDVNEMSLRYATLTPLPNGIAVDEPWPDTDDL